MKRSARLLGAVGGSIAAALPPAGFAAGQSMVPTIAVSVERGR